MTVDYDTSIHSNPDAQAWARFFLDTMRKNGTNIGDLAEDAMIGWFANVMRAKADSMPKHPVLEAVRQARAWQDSKWGEQNHQPVAWHPILMDAVCEAAKVDTEARCRGADPRVFRDALVQVAVVAVEMIECGDRNGWWPR